MSECKYCGYDEKAKQFKPKNKVDRVALAIFRAANQQAMQCCGNKEADCKCWMGYRVEAKAAIKALKK